MWLTVNVCWLNSLGPWLMVVLCYIISCYLVHHFCPNYQNEIKKTHWKPHPSFRRVSVSFSMRSFFFYLAFAFIFSPLFLVWHGSGKDFWKHLFDSLDGYDRLRYGFGVAAVLSIGFDVWRLPNMQMMPICQHIQKKWGWWEMRFSGFVTQMLMVPLCYVSGFRYSW